MSTLNKDEVIEKFCEIVTEIGNLRFNNALVHDCFCGDNVISRRPEVDEEIITYITTAVRNKIRKDLKELKHG